MKRALLVAGVLVLASACGGSCGGPGEDHALVVSDCFFQAGATGSGKEAVERTHPYVAGGDAIFDVRARGWFISIDSLHATSSKPAVLDVISAEVRPADPNDFLSGEKALHVTVHAAAAGDADLIFTDGGGAPVDRRALHVVTADALVLEIPVAVPSIADPKLDLDALRVGTIGADLLVSFLAGGTRADGLGALTISDNAGGLVKLEQTSLGVPNGMQPERDVVRISFGDAPFAFTLDKDDSPFATVQVDPALDVDIAAVDFIQRESLAQYLKEHAGVEVPHEIIDALQNSNDTKIVCGNDNRCAAKVQPSDSAGRPILGAPIRWNLGDNHANDGDILTFQQAFAASTTLTATANGIAKNVTIGGNVDSVQVLRSTAAHCAQAGADTSALGVLALVGSLAVRRRRATVTAR